MVENKYLAYTELEPGEELEMQEQLQLIAQELFNGEGGYLVWRRLGGAGGSWPLGLFETEEEANEVKEEIKGLAEEAGDSIGYYTVEEL